MSSVPYYRSSIFWLLVPPALGGFLFGYDIGGTSYAILQLAVLDSTLPLSLAESPLKTGWFVGAPSAGALLGLTVLLFLDGSGNQTNNRNGNSWASYLLRPIGRKTELFCASILYALGGLLEYQASVFGGYAFAVISVGRLIYGAGIGFAMHGGPTYLAEISPPSIRGMVVSAKEIMVVLGMLCGYLVGQHFCGDFDVVAVASNGGSWVNVYGAAVLVAAAMAAGCRVVPESPRYLAMMSHNGMIAPNAKSNDDGDDNDDVDATSAKIAAATRRRSSTTRSSQQMIAEEFMDDEMALATTGPVDDPSDDGHTEVLDSLRFVWRPQAALDEHRKLLEGMATSGARDESPSSSTASVCSFLSDASFRPALIAGMGLVALQQVTGQPTILSYATPILAGVPGMSSSASVLLAAYKVVATLVSVGLVERYGRKTLLLAGCAFMLAGLGIMVVAFRQFSDGAGAPETSASETGSASMDANSLAALVGMFAYIAGYQVGFGPITWLILSEVFPQTIRGKAVALAVQLNFGGNAVMQLLVPVVDARLGCSKTFLMFCGLTACSVWFVQRCVPETKGLSLEEIESVLAKATTKGNLSRAAEMDLNMSVSTKRRRNSSNEDEEEEEIELLAT